MNVNLQTRIAGQGGMPIIDAPIQTGEGVKQKADDVSLNITENKPSGPLGQTNSQELDAPEGDLRMTPNLIDKTFAKLNDTPVKPNDTPVNLGDGNPSPAPTKPLSAPARLSAAFNIVAILDLIQMASSEMLKVSRDMNRHERQHKAELQASTGKIMRQIGESNAAAARTGAILGSVMTGVTGILSVCGFREQFKAFSKTSVKADQLAVKESTDMLKEVKGYKDVPGEKGLFGTSELKKGASIELQEIKSQPAENVQGQPALKNQPAENLQNPSVKNSDLFGDDVIKAAGKVKRCEADVKKAEAETNDSGLALSNAKLRAKDLKPDDKTQEAQGARQGLDSQRLVYEQKRMNLQEKADTHIDACKDFKNKMETAIKDKQKAVNEAADPLEKQKLKDELKQMQSIRDKECFDMGDGLTKSLNHKVSFTQESLEKSLISASNTEEMAWAKGFETVAGIFKQGFDAGQGFVKMHADAEEGAKRETEHLHQAGETKVDSDIEMAKNMQEDWKRMQQMMIDLRKMVADLEYQTMTSIFKG